MRENERRAARIFLTKSFFFLKVMDRICVRLINLNN